jgi:Fe-S oxidoreductase
MVLNQLSELSVTMIGLDPSMVLCYRDEYQHALGKARGDFSVLLPQEWLLKQAQLKPIHTEQNKEYALFAHCTEKTALPASEKEWQRIFAQFGLSLTAVAVGCCGMAGTYGHESHHLQHSKGIFELSWSQQLAKYDQQQILATGYSCRSQVKRFAASKPKHPIQVLLSAIQNECSISDESVA